MLVLPVSFILSGIHGVSVSIDGLLGINCRAIRMSGNMRGCNRLTAGARAGAGRIILSNFTGSGMGIKRSLADNCHLKYSRIYPDP